jgi:hypothetical protein
MEEKTLGDSKTIAIFSSPDIVHLNKLVTPTMLKNISTGRLSILKDNKKRFIVLCYLKDQEHDPFDMKDYLSLLSSLHSLLTHFQKTDVGIIDDFDNGVNTGMDRKLTKDLLIDSLKPIVPHWTLLKTKPKDFYKFMEGIHTHPLSGHPGIKRTFELLKSQGYYWPGMKIDITYWINACHECRLTKTERHYSEHLNEIF